MCLPKYFEKDQTSKRCTYFFTCLDNICDYLLTDNLSDWSFERGIEGMDFEERSSDWSISGTNNVCGRNKVTH